MRLLAPAAKTLLAASASCIRGVCPLTKQEIVKGLLWVRKFMKSNLRNRTWATRLTIFKSTKRAIRFLCHGTQQSRIDCVLIKIKLICDVARALVVGDRRHNRNRDGETAQMHIVHGGFASDCLSRELRLSLFQPKTATMLYTVIAPMMTTQRHQS